MSSQLPRFQYIDHTADVGLKIFGTSLAELFENAAVGLFDIIADLDQVKPSEERNISVTSTDREALLVDWLSELNYIFLTQKMIFRKFKVHELSDSHLSGSAYGETLDLARHQIHTEVKAVTFHKLYIHKEKFNFEAQVIFDL